MSVESEQEGGIGILIRMEAFFARAVALVLLFFALRYWIRLTGFHPGEEFRFDTMSEHWRVASSSLAVLLPVAALGLWGRFSWGVVVWMLAAVQEIAMHTWFSDLFGRADLTVAFHLVAVSIYIALKLAEFLPANRR